MEHLTYCLVEATVTLSPPGPTSGGGLALIETSRHQYYDWACRVRHQGKECSCDMSRAEPQNHTQMLNAEALLLDFKRKEKQNPETQKRDRF